jgi:hypothetical protein
MGLVRAVIGARARRRGGAPYYEPIARAGHARRRIMAYGLGESWRPR